MTERKHKVPCSVLTKQPDSYLGECPRDSVTTQRRARAWGESPAAHIPCGSVDAAQETGNIPFTESEPGRQALVH